MSYADKLATMTDTWSQNREKTGGFNDQFDDGLHSFQLQSLALQDNNAGELTAKAEQYCLEGSHAGEVFHQWFNLEKENDKGEIWGQVFLAQLFENLGYEIPEDPREIEEACASVTSEHPKFTGRVKTNKDGYKNLIIVKVLGTGAMAEGAGSPNGDPQTPPEKPPELPEGYVVDAKVTVKIEDNDYPGKITAVREKDGKIDVLFEDGDTGDFNYAEAKLVAPAKAPAKKKGTKKKAAGKKSGATDGPSMEELIAFCETWDIEVDDGDNRDSVIAKIKDYDWAANAKEMSKEEKELVAAIGAS